MASLNRVLLIGNVTRDIDVRHTPQGIAVADIGLAVNIRSKNVDGQVKNEVVFVDIIAWDRLAQNCKEFLSKGSPVFVEGRLQLDQWESQQGEKRSRLRVRAENIQFLSSKQAIDKSSNQDSGEENYNQAEDDENTIPF